MTPFNLYSQYYDLLYADKPTEQEAHYVLDRLQAFGVPGLNWLEFGAGSGRHGSFFQQMGIQWTGIERSAAMAAQGQEKGLVVQAGEIQQVSLLPQQFDAVLSLFHVVSYLTANADVAATFANAHRHLRPQGLFAFDVWYTPAVYHQVPEKRTKEMRDASIHVRRAATPTIDWNTHTVNVHYDIWVSDLQKNSTAFFSEDHLMRHFNLPEIQFFANQVGFEFLHAEEWMTGREPGVDTWGVFLIFRKANG